MNPIEFQYRDIALHNRQHNILGTSKDFMRRVVDSFSLITSQKTRQYFLSSDKFATMYAEGDDGTEVFARMTVLCKSHWHFGGGAPGLTDHSKKRYN